ncbi:MAG: hypothetical protein IJ274_16510 [Lachnospiraceae bacterium]|nr:hypothetical protein [Lachnospiraceae bacterium]
MTGATISRYEKGELEIPASSLPLISAFCRFKFSDYMGEKDIFHVLELLTEIDAYERGGSKGAYPPREWDIERCRRERINWSQ